MGGCLFSSQIQNPDMQASANGKYEENIQKSQSQLVTKNPFASSFTANLWLFHLANSSHES